MKFYIAIMFFIFQIFFTNYSLADSTCDILNQIDIKKLEKIYMQNSKRKPNPLPYLHTEGVLPNSNDYQKFVISRYDFKIAHNAALAWKLNIYPNEALEQSKDFINSWVNVYKPSFNSIDESSFVLLLDSYGMVRNEFEISDREKIDKYLIKWAKGYVDILNRLPNNDSWYTNGNSYRVELITLISFIENNDFLINESKYHFKEQINKNIDSKGITLDYKDRDAIHYVLYDLQPLIVSAYIFNKNSSKIDAYNKANLDNAIKWVDPYALGKIKHLEFANSKIRFDKVRADYGMQDYSKHYFDSKKANNYYWQLALYDRNYLSNARKTYNKISNDLVFGCW